MAGNADPTPPPSPTLVDIGLAGNAYTTTTATTPPSPTLVDTGLAGNVVDTTTPTKNIHTFTISTVAPTTPVQTKQGCALTYIDRALMNLKNTSTTDGIVFASKMSNNSCSTNVPTFFRSKKWRTFSSCCKVPSIRKKDTHPQ